MDTYRFYIADLLRQLGPAPGAGEGVVRLPEDQGHHARAVLRLSGGERVTVFDGKGAWGEGEITVVGKREVLVTLQGGVRVDPAPKLRLTIATAVPKGDRAEWLVEQASQLDVSRLVWLDCDRGVVKPGDGKIEKWRRLAIESAKQCGRIWLMEVAEMVGLEDVLGGDAPRGRRILWLEPRAGGSSVGAAIAGAGDGDIMALVGPEGGWSEREFALLEARASRGEIERVRLGGNVLRIETACAAIAAVIRCA